MENVEIARVLSEVADRWRSKEPTTI